MTTVGPVLPHRKEHDRYSAPNTPVVPKKTESRGSSATLNPTSFKRGMIRKNFNCATMKHLQHHQKKTAKVAETVEKPNIIMSTEARDECIFIAGKYAQEILAENDKFYKLAHRIGAEPSTTNPKPDKPQLSVEGDAAIKIINSV
jgi:hypothetical protein